MTKYDINHNVIDPRTFAGSSPVISTGSWEDYQGYEAYWQCCGVEVVADANTSNSQKLVLYAHVYDWIKSQHSSNAFDVYPYIKYGGTSYASDVFSDGSQATHKVYWYPSDGTGIIFGTPRAQLWECYFKIGEYNTVGEYVIETLGAQTGYNNTQYNTWVWSGVKYGPMPSGGYRVGSEVKTSYTTQTVKVEYDGNGVGNGSTASQTRFIGWQGSSFSIRLANCGFSYSSNYGFAGWCETQKGIYESEAAAIADLGNSLKQPNYEYTSDSSTKFYAVWYTKDNKITYYANQPAGTTGGPITGIPAQETKAIGDTTYHINSSIPNGSSLVPPFVFTAWGDSATGGNLYSPGDSYTRNANLSLYAQWRNPYTPTVLTAYSADPYVTVERSDSSGQYDNDGTYLHIKGYAKVFKYSSATKTLNDVAISAVSTVDPQVAITSSITTFSSVSSTNDYTVYKFEKTIPNLQQSHAYTVTITVTDWYQSAYGSSVSSPLVYVATVSSVFKTFSASGKGRSVGVGVAAAAYNTLQGNDLAYGRLDIGMETHFSHGVHGLPTATTQDAGVVKPDGSTITINNGTISASLPQVATSSTPGIVQPDNTSITVSSGVISGLSVEESSDGSLWNYYVSTSADNWTGHNIGWKEEKWSDGRLIVWIWDWYGFASGTPGLMRNEVWSWKSLLENDSLSLPTSFSDTPTWTIDCFARPYGQSTVPQVVYTITGFSNNTSINLHGVSNLASRAAFVVRLEGHWQ